MKQQPPRMGQVHNPHHPHHQGWGDQVYQASIHECVENGFFQGKKTWWWSGGKKCALMTCADVPLDVMLEGWPPKPV